jgi:hypothetical protein
VVLSCLVPDGNGSVSSVASQTRNEELVMANSHRTGDPKEGGAAQRCPAAGAQKI